MNDQGISSPNRRASVVERRRVLQGTAAGGVGLAGLALLGCGDDDKTAESNATTESKKGRRGGKLTIAVGSLGDEALFPAFTHSPGQVYMELMYDWLIGLDAQGTKLSTETGLAKSWTESADRLTWTFEIRDGVTFHRNAGSATSADVKSSLERNMKKDSGLPGAPLLTQTIASIETPDPRTLVIKLKAPLLFFEYLLSPLLGMEGIIYPKSYLEQVGDDGFARNPVGSGPYELVSQQIGISLTLKAVNHWRTGLPNYDEVQFTIVKEASTRLAMVQRGDAQLADLVFAQIDAAKGMGLKIWQVSIGQLISPQVMEMYGASVLADKRVRQAMNVAIDREGISKAFFAGLAQPTTRFVDAPSALGSRGFDLKPYPYDRNLARRLLSEAGYPNGFAFELLNTEALAGVTELPQVGEAVAGYWEDIGIKVKLTPMDSTRVTEEYLRAAPGTRPNKMAMWVAVDRVLPTRSLQTVFQKTSASNRTQDVQLWDLIERFLAAKDEAEYRKLISEIEQYLYDNYYNFGIVYLRPVLASKQNVLPEDWPVAGQSGYSKGFRQLVERTGG